MIKKYRVLMSEIHSVWYTVEAKNEDEAGDKALYGDCIMKMIKVVKWVVKLFVM